MLHNRTHKVSWHPCNEVVPATCPMKFNKLNFVPHVAGKKYRPNWCCTSKKVSVYTKGHVAAIYPWDMYPQHFHVCANVVILPLHVASVCTTQVFCPDATCPCNMTPRVWPPLSVTWCSLGFVLPSVTASSGVSRDERNGRATGDELKARGTTGKRLGPLPLFGLVTQCAMGSYVLLPSIRC